MEIEADIYQLLTRKYGATQFDLLKGIFLSEFTSYLPHKGRGTSFYTFNINYDEWWISVVYFSMFKSSSITLLYQVSFESAHDLELLLDKQKAIQLLKANKNQ